MLSFRSCCLQCQCCEMIVTLFLKDPPSLKKTRNENVLLTLPEDLKVSDIRWLSIWCMRFTVNYAHVIIPADLESPKKVVRRQKLNQPKLELQMKAVRGRYC